MAELAILGGAPVRAKPFPAYNVIGEAEKAAAMRVLDSGVLSRFVGAWHPDFGGGPEVRAFEAAWAAQTRTAHAVAVNSCTSGLYAAVGAAGVGPGDEVIVSPFTMVASVTAAVVFNAVPVFADIDRATWCLTAETIQARITPRTKAVIVVHLFGQSADMDPIMELAARHGLTVIEDCAQAPNATYKDRPVGSLGHIGVFSLNYHKHIHTGEGGMVTTDDERLARRVRLIRNHAEAVVEGMGETELAGLVGFNFRLGEIEAAIGRALLDRLPRLIAERRDNVAYLENRLAKLPHIALPHVPQHNGHVYYVHALSFDWSALGVSRGAFVNALKAELPPSVMRESEGPLIGQGYVKPIYLMPMFRERVAYGQVQCPFLCPHYEGGQDYDVGLCPNTERTHAEILTHELMRPPMNRRDLDDVADAFEKVCANLGALRQLERAQT